MKNLDFRRFRNPAFFSPAVLVALATSNAWAVAGAGPPDLGAAWEGLFYLAVGLVVTLAVPVTWIGWKVFSTIRKRRSGNTATSGDEN